MSEWKEYRLGEIAEIIPGYAFKGKDFGSVGTPIVKIGDITPPIVNTESCERIHESQLNGLERFRLTRGDFVLAMTGATIGKVGRYVSEETAYLNQRVAKFNSKNGVSDKTFIYYLITSPSVNDEIVSRGLGSAQPNVSGRDIEDIAVMVPSLATQTAIAEILSSLDDKIELNNQINKNLEALAQALFKQWFVDFEFPDENGQPYKSSGGEMVESELGMIPKGWRVGKLGEIVKTTSGGTPSRSKHEYYVGGKIFWVKSKELNNSMIFETEEFINEEGLKNSSAKLLPAYSVLIAMYGATVGQFGLVTTEATCNQAICAVMPNENVPFSFNYLFFQNYRKELSNLAVGSAQQNISQELIKNTPLVIPPFHLMDKFHSLAKPMLLSIETNCREVKFLSDLRDTILPRLISGQLNLNVYGNQ